MLSPQHQFFSKPIYQKFNSKRPHVLTAELSWYTHNFDLIGLLQLNQSNAPDNTFWRLGSQAFQPFVKWPPGCHLLMHQIPKLKCFSSRRVVSAQSIEAVCLVENEDIVGTVLTGDATTTSEWATILLAIKVHLILIEIWWYVESLCRDNIIPPPPIMIFCTCSGKMAYLHWSSLHVSMATKHRDMLSNYNNTIFEIYKWQSWIHFKEKIWRPYILISRATLIAWLSMATK